MIKESVTARMPLAECIKNTEIKHDFSLDIAQLLRTHPDVAGMEEKDSSVYCHLKKRGRVELRQEETPIGKVVVYFVVCPERIYDDVESLVKRVNEANSLQTAR